MMKQRAFSMSLSRGVVTAGETTNAVAIAQLMTDYDIGAVVIMRGEKLVGIVSERDIARRVVGCGLDPRLTPAKKFMTKKVVIADFKAGLSKIYSILCHAKFRHLPIMQKGKLVGIASQRDVLYGVTAKSLKKR